MAALTQHGLDNRPMLKYGTIEVAAVPGLDLKEPQIRSLVEIGKINYLTDRGRIKWLT